MVIQETIEEPVTPRIVIEETVIEDTSVPEQGGNSVTFKNLRQIHEQLWSFWIMTLITMETIYAPKNKLGQFIGNN